VKESVRPLAVVLVEPRNPLNIGAAARAMSNFGFFDLRLVRPYDLAFREAVSAVNAETVVREARVFPTVAEAVADRAWVVGATGLAHRQPNHRFHPLPKAARLLRRAFSAGQPVALLFGSEKHGLSNDDVTRCHWLLHIPTRAEHESMNLAQAVAVCLYELVRNPSLGRAEEPVERPARGEDLSRLATLLEEILQMAGYRDFGAQPSAAEKTERLLRRLDLKGKDPAIWTGIFRQLLWRLKNPEA
jgi:tRNA/rRNA methyltransferase